MKVKVREGFQIKHAGKMHVGGDVFDAPESQARRWIEGNIATKAVVKSKNKAVTSSANKSAGAQPKTKGEQ